MSSPTSLLYIAPSRSFLELKSIASNSPLQTKIIISFNTIFSRFRFLSITNVSIGARHPSLSFHTIAVYNSQISSYLPYTFASGKRILENWTVKNKLHLYSKDCYTYIHTCINYKTIHSQESVKFTKIIIYAIL